MFVVQLKVVKVRPLVSKYLTHKSRRARVLIFGAVIKVAEDSMDSGDTGSDDGVPPLEAVPEDRVDCLPAVAALAIVGLGYVVKRPVRFYADIPLGPVEIHVWDRLAGAVRVVSMVPRSTH